MKDCGSLGAARRSSNARSLCGLGLLGVACTGAIERDGAEGTGAGAAADRPVAGGPSGPGAAGPGAGPSGGGAGAGTTGAGGGGGTTAPAPAAFAPGPPVLRRLTEIQYQNSLRDLLGSGTTLSAQLEGDIAVYGLTSVGASRVTQSTRATEIFEDIALTAAEKALATPAARAALVPCAPAGNADAACATQFVTRFGRRAWRRPLAGEEIARYVAVATKAGETLKDFYRGLAFATAGLLQSPHFLYRVEIGAPDATGARRRFDDYEMATRLSYLLWDTTPDDALLDAAARGQLGTPEGIAAQFDRLLASSRTRPAVRRFFTEILRLEDLDELPQSSTTFPLKTATLGASMRAETLQTVSELAFGDADFRDLLSSRVTFVNDELARLYALPPPGRRSELVRVELPEAVPRVGYLGQGSFLALNARAKATSPTLRGKFIRESLLCQNIPDPPPDTNTVLPPDSAAVKRTMREKLEIHSTNPTCAGCHRMIDPVGLAFEHFDALGAYRTTDGGRPIDASGELDGARFDNARDLAGILRRGGAMPCLLRNFFRHAAGRLETNGEEIALAELARGFEQAGFRFGALARALVASPAFRQVANPE
jgi:hypothetical protein